MLNPKKLREAVFQMLYSHDMGVAEPEALVDLLMKELEITKKNAKSAEARIAEILKHQTEIDRQIGETCRSYDFKRIQRVEKNILRLAVFEMLYDNDVPPKVAIAEAIRLARKFSTPESAHFINAILDALYQKSLGAPVDESLIYQAAKSLELSENQAEEAHKLIDEDTKAD
jgi:transcription antitermination protein NusB